MNKADGTPFTVSEIIEMMEHALEARRSESTPGGMRVSYHGPLASAVPSVLRDVERWVEMLKGAVKQINK